MLKLEIMPTNVKISFTNISDSSIQVLYARKDRMLQNVETYFFMFD